MRALLVVLMSVVAIAPEVFPADGQTQDRERRFRARLSTVPIDVSMRSTVAGQGVADATLTGSTLAIDGRFEGLLSAATRANLHRGPRGIRGPALLELTVSGDTAGRITGRFELTSEQRDDLINGRLYVQLHSEKAPDGNLWGWLLPAAGARK